MHSFLQDIRFASRMLVKNPGFTATAVICLALGFGANAAIFSIVSGVLMSPLPYPDAGDLVQVQVRSPDGAGRKASALNYEFWRRRAHAFDEPAALDGMVGGYNVHGTSAGDDALGAARVHGYMVTANYFEVLGVAPAHGRGFLPTEDDPGGPRVVVLSHGLWSRQFGADPGIVGGSVLLNDVPHTVVGVMPARFRGQPASDLWLPLPWEAQVGSGTYNYVVLARLRSGATLADAQADADRLYGEFIEAHPDRTSHGDSGIAVSSLLDVVIGDARQPLLVLFAAVALVLLIACANVAHLLLARAADRNGEMAVRIALGASRGRLLRQLLTESVLLALLSGMAGLLIAMWSFDALVAMLPDGLPRTDELRMDARAVGFTLALTLATGVLFGLAPAVRSFGLDVIRGLKDSAGRGRTFSGGRLGRGVLVSSEVALSLVLLIGAGLLVRTFQQLTAIDPGFATRQVLTAQLSMTGGRYATTDAVDEFRRRLEQRLDALPGVRAVATASNLPLEQPLNLPISLEGWQDRMQAVEYRLVSDRYFQAMEIALRAGRVFDATDAASAPAVVIVNEAFARQFFGDDDAIGQRLTVGFVEDRTREVVGVVGDVRAFSLKEESPATIYVPTGQAPDGITQIVNSFLPLHVVMSTEGDPLALAAAVRRESAAIDPAVPVTNVRTMEQIHGASIAQQRFWMGLIGGFALLALLLSAIGLYGVTSYAVARRTRDIGLRMALGARAGDVLRLVIGQGLKMTAIGVAIGLPVAFGATRFIAGLLYGVGATDPAVFTGIPLLMLAVATVACLVPARRAARIDPMTALRTE